MLKFGNKEFRNLQEQVEKNMKDIRFILEEEGVLNEFGIKVVGQESTIADLPTVAEYKEDNPEWSYGDAYAIGTEAPYTLYILTRANGTHPNDYWFDIGEFPAEGPQGETGPQGEVGPQGPAGNPGADGAAAGFGTITATAQTLQPGSTATATVTSSGPNTEKSFSFTFGIPRGADGSTDVFWGDIQGSLNNQTDLKNALDAKQDVISDLANIRSGAALGSTSVQPEDLQDYVKDSDLATVATTGDYDDLTDKPDLSLKQDVLVSGTNIKTINNTSLLGSGNITIQGGGDLFIIDMGSSTSYNLSQEEFDKIVNHPEKVVVKTNALFNYLTFDYGVAGKIYSNFACVPGSVVVPADSVMTQFVMFNYSNRILEVTYMSNSVDFLQANWNETNSDKISYIRNKPSLFSGDYNDLTNKPSIPTKTSDLTNDSGFITTSALSGYATEQWVTNQGYSTFSGDYNDLSNKPTIPPEVTENTVSGWGFTKNLGTVTDVQVGGTSVVSGGVASITLPTVPTNVSSFTNDAGYITSSALSGYATETWVGQQGYLTDVTWTDVTGKPTFATVATSGSYNDLTDKPTIPDTTNMVTTNTQQTISSAKTFTANTYYGDVANIDFATLNKDGLNFHQTGYYDTNYGKGSISYVDYTYAGSAVDNPFYIVSKTTTSQGDYANYYGFECPKDGSNHFLKVATQEWVASQGYSTFSGSYNDLTNKPSIPTKTSDLTNDSGFITSSYHDATKQDLITSTNKLNYNLLYNTPTLATVATSGSYNDLSNKPTILGSTTETFTFTLGNGTTVTKTIVLA